MNWGAIAVDDATGRAFALGHAGWCYGPRQDRQQPLLGVLRMEIFDPDTGLPVLMRALHVLAGIAWIGLLYYFNLVQVPSFAAYGDEGRARNVSIDKLARRALWWFRWAALTTFVFGILITGVTEDYFKGFMGSDSRFGLSHNAAISVGMVLGIAMLLNVWGVIWRNQKAVLANAANVLAGGEADPAAAGAGRRALLASRTNFIFSFSMLWFMVGASHLYSGAFDGDSSGKAWTFLIIAIVIAGAIELLALGYIGGTAASNKLLWPFENHKNAMYTGGALFVVLYVLSELLLKK
jgi:uncharacterized membrane protein